MTTASPRQTRKSGPDSSRGRRGPAAESVECEAQHFGGIIRGVLPRDLEFALVVCQRDIPKGHRPVLAVSSNGDAATTLRAAADRLEAGEVEANSLNTWRKP